jgi:hypothetical protein
MKICTSPKQAKRLIKLGIDVNTADMRFNIWDQPYVRNNEPIDEYHTACWSLMGLLNILHDYTLQTTTNGKVFVVCDNEKPIISGIYSNPIDACVDAIIKRQKIQNESVHRHRTESKTS